MSVEGLYLTVGFLLGVLITSCLVIAALVVYYEWYHKKATKNDNDIFE